MNAADGFSRVGEARREAQCVRDVAVMDVDKRRGLLMGADGRCYREVETNLWVAAGKVRPRLAYLGTGRHGGGIMLRLLFKREGDTWVNATTGRVAPAHVRLP